MLKIWFVSVLASHLLSTPHRRDDLIALSPYFCSNEVFLKDKRPFTDAQVEFAFISQSQGLSELAKTFAKDNRHRSFAFGTCSSGKNWILSSPASAAPLIERNTSIEVNPEALTHCKSYSVSAITSDSVFPKLDLKDKVFAKDTLRALSLSCTPNDKPGIGPELLALKNWNTETISRIDSPLDLIKWVNQKRRDLGLSEVKPVRRLDQIALKSSANQSLEHPHDKLLQWKKGAESSDLLLLGENRALAGSFSELSTLLWNSPAHRSLLLNARADSIGYAINEVHGQKHLVLVMATKTR